MIYKNSVCLLYIHLPHFNLFFFLSRAALNDMIALSTQEVWNTLFSFNKMITQTLVGTFKRIKKLRQAFKRRSNNLISALMN